MRLKIDQVMLMISVDLMKSGWEYSGYNFDEIKIDGDGNDKVIDTYSDPILFLMWSELISLKLFTVCSDSW